ncbi:MAG: hypothetical protein EOP52_04710 [Sphingobacteriales bacterium]|nr:MAG: hypothetical protein EOP52_04710 [Sphingobacteriales bacterium]
MAYTSLRVIRIPADDGKGGYNISKIDDFEYVNPIDFYEYCIVNSFANMDYNIFSARYPQISPELIKFNAQRSAVDTWLELLKKIRGTEITKNVLSAFKADSKKVQVKSLKSESLGYGNQLLALAFKLWEDYGYTLS